MDSFLYACGLSGPLQFAIRSPNLNEDRVRLLRQPFALIGRDERADVPLDHSIVSRRHVYLQVVQGQAFWIDLDSRSGTSSDGQLRKMGWLDADKTIRIGPFELQRLLGSDSVHEDHGSTLGSRISPLVARSHGSQALPEVALEFLNGPSRSTCWPMNRVMSLIGSANGCKFRLADPSVSPFHCSLLRTPLGLWVIDLVRHDSTGINDIAVRYSLLGDNDVLRVGRYRIRIQSRFTRQNRKATDTSNGRRTTAALPRSLRGNLLEPGFSSGGPTVSGSPSGRPSAWHEPVSGVLEPLPSLGQTSSIEWVTSPASEPIRLDKPELVDSVLVPLVNQFGLMQQQMLDQFQQAISVLVQMFGTLHQDQMNLIREELNQLRDLTKEFHALKYELAARSRDQPVVAPTGPSGLPSDPEAQQKGRQVQERLQSQIDASTVRIASRIGEASAPVLPTISPQNAADISPSVCGLFNSSGSKAPEINPAHRQTEAERCTLNSDRDVVIWLHRRMVALQRERETRWQKILKLLPGLS